MTALPGALLAAVPLAAVVGPAPGPVVAVVGEWVEALPPSRALAARWPAAGLVRCGWCGAPVRSRSWDVVRALLGDVEPDPAVWGCLWCGPVGVGRECPSYGPVPVCVTPRWVRP